jgi:large subunit ribosomal protein L11
VVITVYADKSFTFITKTPPAAVLLTKAAGLDKGSKTPGKGGFVGKVTKKQVTEIATTKLKDLNTTKVESAFSMVAGTARSMGLEIVD